MYVGSQPKAHEVKLSSSMSSLRVSPREPSPSRRKDSGSSFGSGPEGTPLDPELVKAEVSGLEEERVHMLRLRRFKAFLLGFSWFGVVFNGFFVLFSGLFNGF